MIFTQREVLDGLSDYLLRMQSWCDHEGYDDTGVAAVSHGKIGRIRDVVNAVANPVTPGNVALERPVDELLNERILPMPDEVEAFDRHQSERNRVFLVHTEHGQYSDWCYHVRGTFPSYDAAKSYVTTRPIVVYRTIPGGKWEYDPWDEPLKGDEVGKAYPSSTDGTTFEYVGPDGEKILDGYADLDTWYITEYELGRGEGDGPESEGDG